MKDIKILKCEICGYDRCITALEFHHLNRGEKDFSISESTYSRSMEDLKKEVDKCILVCANCHREIHEKEQEEILNDKEKYEESCNLKRFAMNKINEIKFNDLLNKGYTIKMLSETFNVSKSTIKRYKALLKEKNK